MNYIKEGYEKSFADLTDTLNEFVRRGVPGNDCAVYHKGELVYRHMAGYSDIENKIPIKGNEFYNIYSCSKPLTCAAALQLMEQGKFNLDDPLYKYMPEFEHMTISDDNGTREAENKITIRQLFTMSAGFDYDTECESLMRARTETDGRCPTRETMRYLGDAVLQFEPGTKWLYSLCHDILGGLVEELSGMRFGEYVNKNIFEPLGMTKTTYRFPDDRLDEVAGQYTLDTDTGEHTNCGKRTCMFKFGSEYESGGAGVVTCLDDYIKFLEAMRIGDIILKKETIDLMSTNQLEGELMRIYQLSPGRDAYGYGLGVRCPRTADGPQDFGWGGAAGSYIAIDRQCDFTLLYMQHLFGSPIPDLAEKISIGTLARKGVMR